MNTKNERVQTLAKEAALVTGLSEADAIEEGLLLLLRKYGHDVQDDRSRRLDAMRAIRLAWQPGPERVATVDEIDDLYDSKTGLPV